MTVKRTTLIAVLAGLVALLAPHPGSAGYGVQPNGAVQGTPSFLVYLDAEESQPYVQVSSSPELDPSGWFTTFGASCTPTTPFPEPNKYSCQLPSYYSFTPGRTYYWVFTYWKRDDCVTYSFGTYCYLQKHVSGPFPFTVAAPPPAPVAPVLPPADPYEPVGISTKTASSAASLRSSGTWDGLASIKHTALTRVAYAVMKALGRPRTLAVACWTDDDWLSVLESEDDEPTHGDTTLRGFWKLLQPRWLHLAPGVCDDAQSLLDTGVPTGRRASALATLLHETLHAHGLRAEALTNCYAVQLVPLAGRKLGLDSRRAGYLGRLAARYVRSHAPAGYWSAASCRDGGRWDLYPGSVNLR
jgi:hypothetical protein